MNKIKSIPIWSGEKVRINVITEKLYQEMLLEKDNYSSKEMEGFKIVEWLRQETEKNHKKYLEIHGQV